MSSGSSQPQNIVTTQNKDPWAGAQPYLTSILGQAQSLYPSGAGMPYAGITQAALDPTHASALTQEANLAASMAGGSPGVNAGRDLAQNIISNQGIVPGIQDVLKSSSASQSDMDQVNRMYTAMFNDPIAGQFYGDIYGQANGAENPYLQATLDAQGRKIADQVNSAMSGSGRYGSGAHTNILSRNLAEAADPILAQDYQNRQQTKLAAAQGMLGVGQQKLAAASGVGQTNQGIADIYGQALNRAGQYSQLIPQLDQAQYAPLQQLERIGQFYSNRGQEALSQSIDQQNAFSMYPWENLARYSAIANGAGGLGGTTVSSAPNLSQSVGGLQGGIGGALAGGAAGSIFGPVGAGIGALGGGLLGYLLR